MTATRSAHMAPLIIGESPALLQAVELADRYAQSDLPVMVIGETGTGKELIAERIHRHSGRCGDLVDVNCGSLRAELADSLLFGHRRGAFTGAIEATRGLIAEADKGSLFLDELAALPLDTQATLLRAIETHQVRQLGGAKRFVDFRLITAVQPDLAAKVRAGGFRAALFQRIAGVIVGLPPLRERREDIPLLADYFASLRRRALEPGAHKFLKRQPWPYNIRQLRTVIDRAAVGDDGHEIAECAVVEAMEQSAAMEPSHHARASRIANEDEAKSLWEACASANWDIELAGKMLGLRRATMYRRLTDHGIQLRRPSFLSNGSDLRQNETSHPVSGPSPAADS